MGSRMKKQKMKGKNQKGFLLLLLTLSPFFLPSIAPSFPIPLAAAQTSQNPSFEGLNLLKLGIQQREAGQIEAALQSFQQALVIFQAVSNPFNDMMSSVTLAEIGNNYLSLSNYAQAIDYYQRSLEIARVRKNLIGEGRTLAGLGAAYFYLGNYPRAIDHFEQYLGITRELKKLQQQGLAVGDLGLDYPQGEGIALSNLGLAHQALGNYAEAIRYQKLFLENARERKDRPGEGAALLSLGDAFQAAGDHTRAVEYYERSLAIARQIKNQNSEGIILGKLAVSYVYRGIDVKAVSYQTESLAILEKIKGRQGASAVLSALGRAYSEVGNYDAAIAFLEQELVINRELKDQRAEGIVLHNLGVAFGMSGNVSKAEKFFFDSIQVWESIRQVGVGNNDANRVSIFETQTNTYRMLQRVLVAQNKTNKALEIAERGRARAFVELLAQRLGKDAEVRPQAGINPPDLQQIQQIAKVQNATLVQYSILYNEFKTQSNQEWREAEIYIWVIPPMGEITFRQVDLKPLWQQQNSSLQDLVMQSRVAMGARGRSDVKVTLSPQFLSQQQEKQTRNLKQLHELLIQPIADRLPQDPHQRVIFLPQGELFLVPFPALLDANNKSLIEQHTILTAPSIQMLELTRQQRQVMKNSPSKIQNALVVGNPVMPRVVTQVGTPPVQLSDLPGAQREALAIANLLKTKAITGAQATESEIVQQMPNARIIHLATHGLLDDTKGLGIPGAIALAPAGNGELNDGLLTSDEILNMKLNAELVVLSACDTGRGRITGDGVIGLSRSLISAGVPSIVVSLWKVPDDSTAFLMTEFYKNLSTTKDKAQALRRAMLTAKQKYSNPLHWAAFTLIGEAE